MEFKIIEHNFERLEKKLTAIRNKCLKYGCEFSFQVKGDEFRQEKIENTDIIVTRKYIVIDVSGEAKINGWEFIGSIEHTGIENGNIIKCLKDVEIPEKFYSVECACEHCHSNRVRKNTFLIRNTETGEFKQIGKSCLRDYTNGLSAEMAAQFANAYEFCQSANDDFGIRPKAYFPIKDILTYSSEIISKMGYAKSEKDADSTKNIVRINYCYDHKSNAWTLAEFEEKRVVTQRNELLFNFKSPESIAMAENALEWIRNIKFDDLKGNFMHNLWAVAKNEYISQDDLGILVALIPTYQKEIERQKEVEERLKQESKSNFVGNVGDRIIVNIVSAEVVTSWDTDFGTTYINKLVDDNENIYIWKSSKNVVTAEIDGNVKMTVKAHNEYKGTKQTEVQRVAKMKK